MKKLSTMTGLLICICWVFGPMKSLAVANLSTGNLVINEFMATNQNAVQDDQGDYDDWIELYNDADQPVDVSGMSLTDDLSDPVRWTIPAGTTISAFGYLVLWADNEPQEGPYHMNFKLSAAGEQIGLFDATQSPLDTLSFGSQIQDAAFGRAPDGSDVWRTLSRPTPGAANTLNTGGILINEIMYHPYHNPGRPENLGAEYIELYNSSAVAVNLTNWSLRGGVDFVFPPVVLEPGAYMVVAADVGVFADLYPDVTAVIGPWSGHLSNQGESVTLANAQGRVTNKVTYADEGDGTPRRLGPESYGHRGWEWSDDHDGGGKSLELMNTGFANEYGQNWTASVTDGGTPGRVNSVATENIAPVIREVEHTPLIPGPMDPVSVRVLVLDEQTTVPTILLHYRVDQTSDFQILTLFDDGGHNDGRLGDHVYGAIIPAQSDKAIVEFYIEAVDVEGLTRTWPAPVDVDGVLEQVANALYQVDASFDPSASWKPGSEPIYYLIMTEDERAELAYIGSHSNDAFSLAQMNGTFISIDGVGMEARYQAGIRNRGESSRTNGNGSYGNNYRINFVHSDPWQGVTSLNIKNRYGYSQLLGTAIFRKASLAAADTTRIQVRVNGENLAVSNNHMYGSYVAVEVTDSDFTAHQFPNDPDGNAYRSLNDGADLGFKGIDPDNYRPRYQKETNVSAENFNDLILLTDALNNTPQEDYIQLVSQVINLQQWLRFLAADCLAGNREGGLTTPKGDDYVMYRGVQDQRFVLIPYDLDTVFGLGDTGPDINRDIHVYSGLDGLHELLNHPDVLTLYHHQLIELIDTIFSPEQFEPLVERELAGWVPESVIQEIKTFERQRCAAVLAQIPRELSVESSLPVVNGYPYALADTVSLFGTADSARAHSVTVAGQAATWSPAEGIWGFGGGSTVSDFLITPGSLWSYLDDGSDQGTNWQDPAFDDSAWAVGRAELGYGDGGEVTQVGYGPNSNSKYVTTYFRHVFEVTDQAVIASLRLQLLVDDGAVVYLNGLEVERQNMPSGVITSSTPAVSAVSGSAEQQFVDLAIAPAGLRVGLNVLAVEIHQSSQTSSDISFDLSLGAVRPADGEGNMVPGLNRFSVSAFDGPHGLGQEVQQGFLDIWYDTGYTNDVLTSPLAQDTVWTAAQGPYRITGEMVIPAGVTLTIEPGTSVFFESNAGITVHGRLVAQGTEQSLIRFTRIPGGDTWDGIQFVDSPQDNLIAFTVMEYGRTNNGMVGLENSNLTLDHVTFDHTDLRRIRTIDSSLVVSHCVFADIFGSSEAPTTDNLSEHIWGTGVPVDGRFIIEDSTFGLLKGHNDAIDFDGPSRPNPIPQILNNTFLGGGDDALDLETDAHIEGNRFSNFIKDIYNGASGESNAMSAGHGQHYVMVRNIFSHCQHVVQVKDDAFLTFVNNTVVDVTGAAIYFDLGLPGRTAGRGAYVDGSIFWRTPRIFAGITDTTDLVVNHSLLPTEWSNRGEGNIEADPLLVDSQNDFRLRPGSVALKTGPWGLDMGALVPAGAAIQGTPEILSYQTGVALMIGGPGVTHYQYSLNSSLGPWSEEIPVGMPIDLDGLVDGQSYTVYALGKNSAGVWQAEPTVSPSWSVDLHFSQLVLNEILAVNVDAQMYQGIYPDLIELYYDGPDTLDLTGVHLRKDPNGPTLFTFGTGLFMHPGDTLVMAADMDTISPGFHLGFTLDRGGDSLYLYDREDGLLDSVTFGPQIPDLSLGRLSLQGDWTLNVPTFGQANRATLLGDPETVKINEWLAHGNLLYQDDWVELYNPQSWPVNVSGITLTDIAHAPRSSQQIAPLSFIPAQDNAVWIADNRTKPGHLDLKLSAHGENLALLDATEQVIDTIHFGPQTTDVSQGRSPDGTEILAFFNPPTPGSPNPGERFESVSTTVIALDTVWAYRESLPGELWFQPIYDDSTWPLGPALLYVESSNLPGPKNTPLTLGEITYYFRTHFNLYDPTAVTELSLVTVIDDGAIVYLNGHEILRLRLPEGVIDNSTLAATTVGNAVYEGPFIVPTEYLVAGDNLLAVEVHQSSTSSSDIVFGLSLDTLVTQPVVP